MTIENAKEAEQSTAPAGFTLTHDEINLMSFFRAIQSQKKRTMILQTIHDIAMNEENRRDKLAGLL